MTGTTETTKETTSDAARPLSPGLDFRRALESAGFTEGRSGLRRGGIVASLDRAWCAFRTRFRGEIDPLRGHLGSPGLWKPVRRAGKAAGCHWECHVPKAALSPADAEPEEAYARVSALVEWVASTAPGAGLPDGWEPPAEDEVRSWFSKERLTFQSGPFVLQGDLLLGADRLTLRFPFLGELPDGISPARRAWIERVVADAQDRWRMARLGRLDAGEGAPIAAEVDLSGAPREALEVLLPIGLDGLRWVVSRILWSVRFLADPAIRCGVFEASPERACPAERSASS